MNRILLLVCGLLSACAPSFGQTNVLPVAAPPLPSLALKLSSEPKQSLPAISLSATTNSFVGLSLLPNSDNPLQATNPLANLIETPPAFPCPLASPLFPPPPEWPWRPLPVRTDDMPKPRLDAPDAVSLLSSREMNPDQIALFERIEREGLLKPPEPVYDSEIDRAVAAAFRPEIIHVGHAQFSCSIITAIARKNPFCLLDPSFLGISF